VIINPYLMAVTLGLLLLLISCALCITRKFVGLILFLVYVGGIMILIRYCVMLLPSTKYLLKPTVIFFPFTLVVFLSVHDKVTTSYSFGLQYSHRAIVLLSLLLFIVLLSLVEVVDYSSGMFKQ